MPGLWLARNARQPIRRSAGKAAARAERLPDVQSDGVAEVVRLLGSSVRSASCWTLTSSATPNPAAFRNLSTSRRQAI